MENVKKITSAKKTKSQLKSPKIELPNGWDIKLWKDETSREYFIEFLFPVSSGGNNRVLLPNDCIDSPPKIRMRLRQFDAALPQGKANANEFIEGLLAFRPQSANNIVAMPGWHDGDYVMPNRIIGKQKGKIKLSESASAKCCAIGKKGSIEDWTKAMSSVSDCSSYFAFSLMAAFAAPLMKFSGLPEGAVYNFSMASSKGKTKSQKCAASVFGDPVQVADWNSTGVSLEELAAANNDMLLVLDDTEKGVKGDITVLLDKAAHVITEGRSRSRSRHYEGNAGRKARWHCLAISSSPTAIDTLYAEKGQTRTEGQRVRFIDMPIPIIGEAGLFDRIEGTEREIERRVSRELKNIDTALTKNYGTAIGPWIRYIQANDLRDELERLSSNFVTRAVPTGRGTEKRLAAKFGLVFAAGVLVNKAGIVRWKERFVEEVVTCCFDLARAGLETASKGVEDGYHNFKSLVCDKSGFPFLKTDLVVSQHVGDTMLGFRARLKEN